MFLSLVMALVTFDIPYGVAGSGKSILWCVDQLLLPYRETYVEKFRDYQRYCNPA